MIYYDTVTEALAALKQKGYSRDFSLLKEEECIYCHASNSNLDPNEFVIDEVHRFEGDSDPGDEMIIYAISSLKYSTKGTLVNAFGPYADIDISRIVEKLKYKSEQGKKPIKRNSELLVLSREHHHALLLCWKIKTIVSLNGLFPGYFS